VAPAIAHIVLVQEGFPVGRQRGLLPNSTKLKKNDMI
jgi:hypothetical protein